MKTPALAGAPGGSSMPDVSAAFIGARCQGLAVRARLLGTDCRPVGCRPVGCWRLGTGAGCHTLNVKDHI